jgi:hypothetical protein
MSVILVGYCVRRFAPVSHYILKNGPDGANFDEWATTFIDRYDQSYQRRKESTVEEVEMLQQLGCAKVSVAPEAMGSLRVDLWTNFISEQTRGTFVVVTSWSNFCPDAMLPEMLEIAKNNGCFVIKPEHLPLTRLPLSDDELQNAYQSWVMSGLGPDDESDAVRIEQIMRMVSEGRSTADIQVELGISRSTLFRLKSKVKHWPRKASSTTESSGLRLGM